MAKRTRKIPNEIKEDGIIDATAIERAVLNSGPRVRLTPTERGMVFEKLIASGMGIQEMAAHTGYSQQLISKYLAENGYQVVHGAKSSSRRVILPPGTETGRSTETNLVFGPYTQGYDRS